MGRIKITVKSSHNGHLRDRRKWPLRRGGRHGDSRGVYLEIKSGLLMGCGKKWEILRHFQGKLCGKKGLLCGKLCDFFKADLTLFF